MTSGVLAVLVDAARAVHERLEAAQSWSLIPGSDAQHHSDLAADEAAVSVLRRSGFRVLSEESGLDEDGDPGDVLVVLDPLDGSTNAAQRIPWYAASLCAVDAEGPLAAVVRNLADGTEYTATRGGGSRRDGETIEPSGCRRLGDAIVGLSGLPPADLGWRQFRVLGACALDLCAVADGTLDGYLDAGVDAHGVWDYLAGAFICEEAGAATGDACGRSMVELTHEARRTPLAGATAELFEQLKSRRREVYGSC